MSFFRDVNLISFKEPLTIGFRKSAGAATIAFEAGRDYLIATPQLERIMQDPHVQQRLYRVSRADMRIPNFHVDAFLATGKIKPRVLLFNGSGGYGDQIVTWPVAKILHDRGYSVHVMTDPGNNVCWWNFKFVRSFMTIPCLWEQIKLFDAFIPFEAVVNLDEHQDQGHPVDVMLDKIGIDSSAIDPKDKVVRPSFTESELGSLISFLKLGKKIGLYQLSAANPIRCLPANDSIFMLLKVAEATPDTHWLALYDEFVPPEYKTNLEQTIASRKITNIQPFCAPNLRELWALTEHASVVVAPDSMMVHISGVFGTPCVGLWGPMDPVSRVRYYANHHALYPRQFCPHSPCFGYSNVFPRYCPPRPDRRTTCDVLAGISPNEVANLVTKVQR